MEKRGYKYRIYPDQDQEVVLKKTLGCCRFVYNKTLELRSNSYKNEKKSVGYLASSKALTQLKKHPEMKWLNDVSSVSLQQSVRNANVAFECFFKKTSKYPRYKKRKNGGSARFVGEGFSMGKRGFKVNRVDGPIKVTWSRKLPSKPSSCTISQNPSGQWFVSFVCEVESEILPKSKKRIGIDLGIEVFATLSDNRQVKQSDSIRKSRRKLTQAQRAHSRKKTRLSQSRKSSR